MEERFEDYKLQLNSKQQSLSAWELISLVGSGHFSKGIDRQTLSMGINEVYLELILDVLKQVGGTPEQIGPSRLEWWLCFFQSSREFSSYSICPSRQLWYELLSFGDISCRDVSLLSNI